MVVREMAVEARFRERIRQEREYRKWSQAAVADMLSDKGIKGVYPTTVAKIESGERAVRIDEAAALADLFDMSVDALMGRSPGSQPSELAFQLRTVRDTARQIYQQVYGSVDVIRELLDDLPSEFDYSDEMQRLGRVTWERLFDASELLIALQDLSQELLRRQQGRPELAEEALSELFVDRESEVLEK